MNNNVKLIALCIVFLTIGFLLALFVMESFNYGVRQAVELSKQSTPRRI